jgi:hypothetical protein
MSWESLAMECLLSSTPLQKQLSNPPILRPEPYNTLPPGKKYPFDNSQLNRFSQIDMSPLYSALARWFATRFETSAHVFSVGKAYLCRMISV